VIPHSALRIPQSEVCQVSRRFLRVWQRNWVVYRKTWKVGFLPPLLEPLLYLLAFGLGLSSLVGRVRWGGAEVSYLSFLAPGLLAVNIMNNAFFENTYASFVRMYYQRTFHAMLATPLSVDEIIVGEIAWGATKSAIATFLMLSVVSAFGLIRYPEGLLILPVSVLGGLAFGAAGMIFTAVVPNIEMFNLPMFLFVTPMFLFGGTFFPLSALPAWAQKFALLLPLTHLVNLTRDCALGSLGPGALWSVGYLVAFAALLFPVAVVRMRRRLIH
jgi:lipooligosaccharide transport system permease protein